MNLSCVKYVFAKESPVTVSPIPTWLILFQFLWFQISDSVGQGRLLFSFSRRKNLIFTFFYILAYNGHTECLKLLLQHAEAEGVVDCLDGQDRWDTIHFPVPVSNAP